VLARGRQTILKGAWSGHVNHLNFWWAPVVSLEWLKLRVVKLCKQIGYVKSYPTDDKSNTKGVWSGSCDRFKFWGSRISLEWL